MSNKSTSASGRYVFFRSLLQFPDAWLYPAIPDATSRLRSISGQISINKAYDEQSQGFMDRIQKYLDFIRSMADNLKSNELAFLEQQKRILQQENDPNTQKLITALDTLNNPKTDYLTIMSIMNNLMQNQEQFSSSIENQISRMTQAKETWESFRSTDWLVKMFEEEYKKYSGIFASNIKKQHNIIDPTTNKIIDQYGESMSEALAKKANEVLRNLSNNDEFLDILTSTLTQKNLKMSDNEFKDILINLVADQVINSSLNDEASDIIDRIISSTKTNSSFQALLSSVDDAEFSRIVVADFTPFEQLVLTTKKSIAGHIRTLDDRSVAEIIKNYPQAKDLIQILRNLSEKEYSDQSFAGMKSKLTTIIKTAVKTRAKEFIHEEVTKDPMPVAEFKTKFGQIRDFITPTQLKTSLKESLKGVHFSHDIIGEILASNDARNQIRNVIINNLPGISISFKADIRYSTGYVGSNDIQPSDKHFNQIQQAINNVIAEHYSRFLEKYKDKSGGSTNIKDAQEVYREWLLEMKTSFDTIIDNDQELNARFQDRTILYKQFYETFSNSVSVKDYSLYNNTLGFHGGSLGSHSNPEKVIDNITQMYELGGISNTDAEELLFAVLNCGEAMLGNNLKTSLETYLLGGAALIMFDDSFAASDQFLAQLTDSFKGQRIVNLYRLNTFYVPASFVLDEIYNNLKQIYQSLNSEINTLDQHNRVSIINNVTYSDEIAKGNTPQEKAESISKYTQSNIDIQFSFMGGLLDILNNLPSIININ